MPLRLPSRIWSRAPLLAAVLGMLLLAGCHKPKPAPVAPQAQAPTISQPEAAPQPPPTPATTAPAEVQPAPTTPPESTPASAPAPPPKKPHHSTRKVVPAPATTAPATTPGDAPGKTVVPQGSAPATGTQLTPNLTPEEAELKRQGTVQLLAATEANLKNLAQPLSREDQATVEDIHTYMAQSRAAMADGDLGRAYNLADKAHQLSKALPKK